MNWNYRKRCLSHMNARYPFSNKHQMFPLSSVETCQVVVVPESLEPRLLYLMKKSKPFRWRFQGISFRHTLVYLFLKIMFSHFDKPQKAQNAHAAAAPSLQSWENGFIAPGVYIVDLKDEMQSICPDSFYNFQNIEISKVVTFH